MKRLIIIFIVYFGQNYSFAQLSRRMNIITNLNTYDSVGFNIRRVNCEYSKILPYAFFKLVKTDSVITLSYQNDSTGPHKIKLTANQIKQIVEIENKIKRRGSTAYDEYTVIRKGRIVVRARDIKHSDILTGFFSELPTNR